MKKIPALLCIFLSSILITSHGLAQSLLRPNEAVIFSFKTTQGKKLVLAKDTGNQYVVYRFGTANKIDMEFPGNISDSWAKFTYSFYLRGGGKENDGLDLNYLQFTNDGFKYVIYDTYSATANERNTGVKVIQLATGKTTDIRGLIKTRKGSLVNLRSNELINQSEEIFD